MGPRDWIGNTNLREIAQYVHGTSVSLTPRLESGKTCKAVGDGIVKCRALGIVTSTCCLVICSDMSTMAAYLHVNITPLKHRRLSQYLL